MKKIFLFCGVVALSFVRSPAVGFASPGSLDSTFGVGGVVVTDRDSGDTFHGVTVQPDGKIVAVGTSYDDEGESGNTAVYVVRYLPHGLIDSSFANTKIDFGPQKKLQAVGFQEDGKIVVSVSTSQPLNSLGPGPYYMAIARVNPNGTLDTTFGDAGIKTLSPGGDGLENFFGNSGLAIGGDGKILLSGSLIDKESNLWVTTVRLGPDGELDTSFGGDGVSVTNIEGFPEAVAVQNDGKIVIAGSEIGGTELFVARLLPNGSLDTAFAGKGFFKKQMEGGPVSGARVAVQWDGKIVAAGTVTDTPLLLDFFVVRLHPNGDFDSTFSGDGIAKDSITANERLTTLTLLPNGRILLGGFSEGLDLGKIVTAGGFAMIVYKIDGSLDETFFGVGHGKFAPYIGGPEKGVIRAVAVQKDGRIVVAGSSFAHNDTDFTLARYEGPSVLLFNPQFVKILSICGNGKVEGAEACDDWNKKNGDGCSAVCKKEPRGMFRAWIKSVQPYFLRIAPVQ